MKEHEIYLDFDRLPKTESKPILPLGGITVRHKKSRDYVVTYKKHIKTVRQMALSSNKPTLLIMPMKGCKCGKRTAKKLGVKVMKSVFVEDIIFMKDRPMPIKLPEFDLMTPELHTSSLLSCWANCGVPQGMLSANITS